MDNNVPINFSSYFQSPTAFLLGFVFPFFSQSCIRLTIFLPIHFIPLLPFLLLFLISISSITFFILWFTILFFLLFLIPLFPLLLLLFLPLLSNFIQNQSYQYQWWAVSSMVLPVQKSSGSARSRCACSHERLTRATAEPGAQAAHLSHKQQYNSSLFNFIK